jgi:acyl CoA:acetate/3-ketoacid CoA transferase beta subunit
LIASSESTVATVAVGVAEADTDGDTEALGLGLAVVVDEGLPQAASASTQARAGIRRE